MEFLVFAQTAIKFLLEKLVDDTLIFLVSCT